MRGEPTNVVATPLRGVGKNVPPAFAKATAARQARGYSEHQNRPNAVKLTDTEWQDNLGKLAAVFATHLAAAKRPLWECGPELSELSKALTCQRTPTSPFNSSTLQRFDLFADRQAKPLTGRRGSLLCHGSYQ